MFRTPLHIPRAPFTIGHFTPILTLGSCFSDNIGHLLRHNKFNVSVNPFGTSYNPVSIFKTLRLAVAGTPPPAGGYLAREGVFVHHDFHSKFASAEKEVLENTLVCAVGQVREFLKNADFLIITFGTAFVYERNDTGEVVANCHKVAARRFSKRLLTPEQIQEPFERLLTDLRAFNPALKIILTLSPVRHVKDTLPLNSVSKALLRVICHTLSQRYEEVSYFPAYELMIDDLRDYRFYGTDMIHPTPAALEYIWEKFCHTYMDDALLRFLKTWKKIKMAIDHKPFNPGSENHQTFIKDTIRKIEQLDQGPDFFRDELETLEARLKNLSF